MSSIEDRIFQRRPIEFYIGKVLWVRGAMVPPGYPEGYFIPLRIDPATGGYVYHFIGTERPPGEEIYIHADGRRDLQAVPETVVPPASHFAFWWIVYVIVAGFFAIVSADDYPIFAVLLFTPILAIPFQTWFTNVEPVRATKFAYLILGAEAALALKQKNERNPNG